MPAPPPLGPPSRQCTPKRDARSAHGTERALPSPVAPVAYSKEAILPPCHRTSCRRARPSRYRYYGITVATIYCRLAMFVILSQILYATDTAVQSVSPPYAAVPTASDYKLLLR
jgi:hypothetical protein